MADPARAGGLLEERRLWQFMEGVKGWRFTGDGFLVVGPDDGVYPIESSQLPLYVAERPSLMAEYTKWEAERHRSSGPAAAEKGGGGQAATGEGQSEDSDKDGRPLEPEKACAPASSAETANPPSSPAARPPGLSAPAPAAVAESEGASDDVGARASSGAGGDRGAAPAVEAMVPSGKVNAAQPCSPAAAAAAAGAPAAARAATPISPPDPNASAPPKEGGAPQAEEEGVERQTPPSQPRQQKPEEAEVKPTGGAREAAAALTTTEAAAAAADRTGAAGGFPAVAADDKEAAQGGKEAAVMQTAAGGEKQAPRPPVGGGESSGAGGIATAAAAESGQAAGKSTAAAGPCLCPRDEDGKSVHKTVQVERRCWPGSNKPGGVARITKRYTVVEEVCGETVENTYFDVKYLLGGGEKRVKETFISCSPLETEARQSTQREIFTVEAPQPTRRQRSAAPPKPTAGARTTPLSTSVGANSSASASASSARGKVKAGGGGGAAKKQVHMVKRSQLLAGTGRSGGDAEAEDRADKRSKKRARAAAAEGATGWNTKGREGGGGKKGAPSSSKTSKEKQLEVPPVYKKERHAITDLSVVAEVEKAPDAPLSGGRMGAFQEALHALFRQSTNDTISLAKLEADINDQRPPGTAAFADGELKAALKYLEEVESKVMLDGGMIYRI